MLYAGNSTCWRRPSSLYGQADWAKPRRQELTYTSDAKFDGSSNTVVACGKLTEKTVPLNSRVPDSCMNPTGANAPCPSKGLQGIRSAGYANRYAFALTEILNP